MERKVTDSQLTKKEQLTEESRKVVTVDNIKTNGVCGGRRLISDLDTCDSTTKFSTEWMSGRSDYDSQVMVVDNKDNYTDHLETGNVRVINIMADSKLLCDWLLAEGQELIVIKNAITRRND